MTTASRRKTTDPTPEPHPDGDTGSDALGAATVADRAGQQSVIIPDVEGHAEALDEAESRRAQAVASGQVGIGAFLAPLNSWQQAQRDDNPLTVHEAIAEVTRQVQPIAKDRRSSGPGENYNFRGIDDVLEALHPILGDVGLLILPGEVVEHRRESRPTKSGGTLNVALLRVRYTFVGPDGTELTGEAWGEAGDSGDKATQKAHSQSYKTLCLQTFSIPTQQSAADDPDATNEPARAWTGEELDRAARARDAARDATTIEELAGVRRRADALLSVPVPDGDAAMPLELFLVQRLRELTGAPAGGE